MAPNKDSKENSKLTSPPSMGKRAGGKTNQTDKMKGNNYQNRTLYVRKEHAAHEFL